MMNQQLEKCEKKLKHPRSSWNWQKIWLVLGSKGAQAQLSQSK